MRRIFKIFVAIMLALTIMPVSISATVAPDFTPEDDALVCLVTESWAVVSMDVSYKVTSTVALRNNTNSPQTMSAESTRAVYTESATGVSISVFESLFGISAETTNGNSYSISVIASPVVPAYTTYYVDFGYEYVSGTIRMVRTNSDCSTTYTSQPYDAEYTYRSYVEIRG